MKIKIKLPAAAKALLPLVAPALATAAGAAVTKLVLKGADKLQKKN